MRVVAGYQDYPVVLGVNDLNLACEKASFQAVTRGPGFWLAVGFLILWHLLPLPVSLVS